MVSLGLKRPELTFLFLFSLPEVQASSKQQSGPCPCSLHPANGTSDPASLFTSPYCRTLCKYSLTRPAQTGGSFLWAQHVQKGTGTRKERSAALENRAEVSGRLGVRSMLGAEEGKVRPQERSPGPCPGASGRVVGQDREPGVGAVPLWTEGGITRRLGRALGSRGPDHACQVRKWAIPRGWGDGEEGLHGRPGAGKVQGKSDYFRANSTRAPAGHPDDWHWPCGLGVLEPASGSSSTGGQEVKCVHPESVQRAEKHLSSDQKQGSPHKNRESTVRSGSCPNRQKVETAQVSTNW